jgi:prevent-host-death family protein
MNVSATELKTRLGKYLDVSETDPVIVEKSGRPKSVLISKATYEKFLAYEDSYWAAKAEAAEKEGFFTLSETESILKNE